MMVLCTGPVFVILKFRLVSGMTTETSDREISAVLTPAIIIYLLLCRIVSYDCNALLMDLAVFVMVTIGLSALSVISSIFIFRMCANSTSTVPRCVHTIVFRCLSRLLCVPVLSTEKTSSISMSPDDASCGQTSSTNCSIRPAVIGGSVKHTDGSPEETRAETCYCQLKAQVDSVLLELRTVTSSICCCHCVIHTCMLQKCCHWNCICVFDCILVACAAFSFYLPNSYSI